MKTIALFNRRSIWIILISFVGITLLSNFSIVTTLRNYICIKWQTWTNISKTDLRIIVITFNRPKHLQRLLESLDEANYDGDKVVVDIWIDVANDSSPNTEVLALACDFKFTFASKTINVHENNAGIIGQWVYTWKQPRSSSEIAVILEDDLTVSPYFYRYLKAVHKKYGHLPYINGFALQGESIKHSGDPGPLTVPSQHRVFLYPTLGTWGFSPNTKNWFQYVAWFTEVYKNKTFHPLVPGNIASNWFQEFLKRNTQDDMWDMWHIYYAWTRKESTVYPNFKDQKGLTFNWKAPGLHYKRTNELPDNADQQYLVLEWEDDYAYSLPNSLPVVNNSGHITGSVTIE